MYAHRFFIGVVTLSLLCAGCRSHRVVAKPAPDPAPPQTVDSIREAYARSYPESRVGVVIAARPVDRLAAVGDVSTRDFRDGQFVTFIDSHQRVLTTGTVARVLPDQVHIRYENPPLGGREPRPGDVMIRVAGGTESF
jgi:hypothetical protein